MLARERAAMNAEDWQSFVAQRYYYRSAQLPALSPNSDRTYAWQEAYEQTQGHWLNALQLMRNLRDMLRRGLHRQALTTLVDELSSDEAEDAEEEALETDVEMEEGAAEVVQMPAPFSGIAYRLED